MNRLWFLTASAGNRFMTELLAALAAAATRAGAEVAWACDGYPEAGDRDAYVVVPHEFFECTAAGHNASATQLSRTVAVCVEQPGTAWFETSAGHAHRVGRALDINRTACHELRRRGVRAEHLQLGYVPEWDLWAGVGRGRPVDVLYMGSDDQRRAAILAGFAEPLAEWSTRLLIPPLEPKPEAAPNFLVGPQKYEQLMQSKLLLNIHRSDAAGLFEWMRALEAICNGCVVVSEHSLDHAPLQAGEHFVSGPAEHLGQLAVALLENPQRLEQLRQDAYEFIRSELTLDAGIGALLDAAEAAVGDAAGSPSAPLPLPSSGRSVPGPADPPQEATVEAAVRRELAPVKAALKALTLEALNTRRRLDALEHGIAPGQRRSVDVVSTSEAYRGCRPRVSVLISLHNYELEVVEALASVARSDHTSYEVLVLDDASTDGSRAACEDFLARTGWLALALFGRRANLGLGATRNALVDLARGEYVFILDADNAIFPHALTRLENALGRSPGASFAYGMSAIVDGQSEVGLTSVGLWNPDWLSRDNYIDAMALIRRSALVELGGYTEDVRLTGWEDYDLWLRMAERGMHPIHVPEVIGRYRRHGHSMVSTITNIDDAVARSVLRGRSPSVFNPRRDRRPTAQLLAPPSGGIELWLDEPREDAAVTREQTLMVSGWAAGDTRIERVSIEVADLELEPHRGLPRPDVAARHPALHEAAWSGFVLVLPVNRLSPGEHRLAVTACTADGQRATRTVTVTIGPVADEDRGAMAIPTEDIGTDSSLELWVLAAGAAAEDIARTRLAVERQTLRPQVTRAISEHGREQRPVASLERALHGVSSEIRYVVVVTAGDEPRPDALARVSEAMTGLDPDVIFGDEDLRSATGGAQPFYKPGWSPELQQARDYVGSFAAIRIERLSRAIARRPNAASGGELVRALMDDPSLAVEHVPHVLCTCGERPRVVPAGPVGPPPRSPLVSIVIPTAARGRHLERCLGSLGALSTYEQLEVVIVDSSSDGLGEVSALADRMPVHVVRFEGSFNYSASVNDGARLARGEYLVLLNDDVEVISPDWVERLLEHALRPGVGIVGAKLVRSDGTIQHGGVLVHAGSAEHLFEFFADEGDEYQGLLGVPRNCSAVTAACLMIRTALFEWMGGLDEAFVLDYGDTDLCLRALELGQRVVWTPDAVLRHDDRSSRGSESPPTDLKVFRKHWGDLMRSGDPYYNPNLAIRPQFEPLAATLE